MQLTESTDDELAKELLTDIANEERVHAGEFLKLLYYLEPEEEENYYKEGFEVEELRTSITSAFSNKSIFIRNLYQSQLGVLG